MIPWCGRVDRKTCCFPNYKQSNDSEDAPYSYHSVPTMTHSKNKWEKPHPQQSYQLKMKILRKKYINLV